MSITIYAKPNCPQCELTKRDMDILGLEYRTIDLTQVDSLAAQFAARGFRSAPIVETDSGMWSGYDQDKIKALVSYV